MYLFHTTPHNLQLQHLAALALVQEILTSHSRRSKTHPHRICSNLPATSVLSSQWQPQRNCPPPTWQSFSHCSVAALMEDSVDWNELFSSKVSQLEVTGMQESGYIQRFARYHKINVFVNKQSFFFPLSYF